MDLDSTQSHPLSNWPRPLAFVFSGGAAFGATQVGMLRALNEAGIVPDLIVGTSVGALNGVRYAADPAGAIGALTDLWGSLSGTGVFGGKSRAGTILSAVRNGLNRNAAGLCSPEPLRKLIDANISVERIEQLTIPTAVVATDALVGQPKLLTQGDIAPALQATAAIPGVFPPVKIEGCFYLDGGVTANVPVRQAFAFGAKSVVVLDANPATMPGTLPHSVLGTVMHASMIMLRNQRADAVDDLIGRHPILHLPQVTPTTQSSFDFDNSFDLIAAGHRGVGEFLEKLPSLTDASRGTAPKQAATPPPPPPTAADVQTQPNQPDQPGGSRPSASANL